MKPLYWTRIQLPVTPSLAPPGAVPQPAQQENVLWDNLEDVPIEVEEFDSLFSRAVVKPKKKEEKKEKKEEKVKSASVLDGKRSQNIGILLKSQHLDISMIEQVVYNCDNSDLDFEVLQQIKDIQATSEELPQLKSHVEANPTVPLDKPDQFLLDLAGISHFDDRLTCFMFQNKFSDLCSEIENRLNNIRSVCDFVITSEAMKQVFGVILACGNYMNGGNRQRGQADGFNIDILPKVKDVKSKDNANNLLSYIVRFCITKYDDKRGTNEAALPVPEAADVEKCTHIDFETQKNECEKIMKELEIVKNTSKKIVEKSSEETKEPFQTKMSEFLEKADGELKNLTDLLEDCVSKFIECMRFYKFAPKKGKLEDAKPEDFFVIWYPFCSDYKNYWKKEQARVQKELLKEERQRHQKKKESLQNVEIKKTPVSGLKAKLQRRKTRNSSVGAAPPPTQETLDDEDFH